MGQQWLDKQEKLLVTKQSVEQQKKEGTKQVAWPSIFNRPTVCQSTARGRRGTQTLFILFPPKAGKGAESVGAACCAAGMSVLLRF